MRIPVATIQGTHLRFSAQIFPGFTCLLAGTGIGLAPANASGSALAAFAPRALVAIPLRAGSPPSAAPGGVGSGQQGSDSYALYHTGVVDYKQGKYAEAIDALQRFVAIADATHIGDANLYLGDAYTVTKDYENAVLAYTSYFHDHPDDASHAALGSRAYAYLMLNKYAEASADFKAYLAFRPQDKTAWNNYIVALTSTSKTPAPEIIEALRGALNNDPDNLSLRSSLARKQIETKDYAGAITQYDAMLAAKPNDFRVLYDRGVAYGLTKDPAKAAADFDAYTKLRPRDAPGWNNLGVFLGQQKDYKGSIAAFTQYISLMPSDPDFIVAYKNRAIDYYNLSDWKDAETDLRRYGADRPDDPDVPRMLAQVAGRTGGDAVAPLEDLFKRTPEINDAASWFNLGIGYLGKSDYEKAAAAFTRSNAIKPDPETLYNLALVNFNLGEAGNSTAYVRAESNAAAALALKPDYPDALLVKADAEYAQKKTVSAAADYSDFVAQSGVAAQDKVYAQTRILHMKIENRENAAAITTATALIVLKPDDAQTYFLRGTVYIAMRKFTLAIPDLMKYTGMKAEDASGWYNLGIAYSGKKDTAKAAASYETASTVKLDDYDAAEQAGTAYRALADGHQGHAVTSAAAYEKAIRMYDRAARMPSITRRQRSDSLYNEATTLEAKARLASEPESLGRAIGVWQRWLQVAGSDPEAAKIRARVIYLQKHVGKGN